ncbi:MAG: hypothetical protein Q8P67_03485, partial [archaeon]|nr:hypothetical protein [archaeon]
VPRLSPQNITKLHHNVSLGVPFCGKPIVVFKVISHVQSNKNKPKKTPTHSLHKQRKQQPKKNNGKSTKQKGRFSVDGNGLRRPMLAVPQIKNDSPRLSSCKCEFCAVARMGEGAVAISFWLSDGRCLISFSVIRCSFSKRSEEKRGAGVRFIWSTWNGISEAALGVKVHP